MLRRQRTILDVLGAADGALCATQLQKFVFLLREETFLGRDAAFYEFLPYKFGPFSFAASRETEALRAYGYIEPAALRLTPLGSKEANRANSDARRAANAIVSQYGKKPLRTLLEDVYARYPWYASNTELGELLPYGRRRPRVASLAVYTIGYEARSVDGFLNELLQTGIHRIVDVRANPVSRKYGFARSSLASLAGKLKLGYSHFPGLGISSERRRGVRSPAEFLELFSYYEKYVLPANLPLVREVADLVRAGPSVLVCMEKDASGCHRSRLAKRVARIAKLDVVHL